MTSNLHTLARTGRNPFSKIRLVALALFAGVLLAAQSVAWAHDLFAAFIQHRVALVMGARHVDVTVQLTFFEEESERERERIDTDRDGRLSRAEIDAYLQELESRLANAVTLTVDGRPLSLTPLRAMDLDLMGQNRSGQGHHRLTLYYFAPTPNNLKLGTEVVVHDRLWPHVRALGSIQTEGMQGCRLEALPPSDPIFPPTREGEARGFKARVLSLPTSTHARAASPSQSSRSQSNKQ